ncbi:MBL fold metallo-hydrolase [Bacteroides uniformis]|nr:MBL fold metallo-hydrolase [Bacteroides uniformis]MCY6318307.1 MBL fold metallo-hydrolase [Bacteroides uniformis]
MNIHQIVNSVFTSNTYILSVEGKDGHVLIDIGDITPIRKFVQEKGGTVQALFLTHTHYDHIYGIKDLLRLYPDCMVYTSSFGKEALSSDKLNFSRYHNDPVIWMGDNVTVCMRMIKWKYFREFLRKCLKLPGMIKAVLPIKLGTMFFRVIHIFRVLKSLPHSLTAIREMRGYRKIVSWN